MHREDATQGAHHELIGSEVSLYTGKVRAYLRYKDLRFEETLATREVYKNVIVPRTGVRFIPVLVTGDDIAIQDSTEILEELERRFPEPAIHPATPRQRLAALFLELYGDEWLVIPAMHYRWSFEENRSFAIREFGRTSAPDRAPAEQQAIGERLSAPFAGALPHLGITADTIPAIERSYLGFLAEFEKHLEQHPYLLGTRPSIGDFGLVGPLYAHLYRDPYSGRLLHEVAPRVHDWVERMVQPVPRQGDFLAGDEVPVTLAPLLARMFREQVPVLLDEMRELATWSAVNPEGPLPRSIGAIRFELEGVAGTRSATPYPQWMWQRCVDFYRSVERGRRAALDAWLRSIPGAADAVATPIPVRVQRCQNRLVRV